MRSNLCGFISFVSYKCKVTGCRELVIVHANQHLVLSPPSKIANIFSRCLVVRL